VARRLAVFLDRDGVITQNIYYEKWGETEGPMTPEDVRILPGALDGMKLLDDAGFLIFIVSNQGAFAKGKIGLSSLVSTARAVSSIVKEFGIRLTDEYYSFSHPDGAVEFFSGPSLERKPNPYFLKLAEAGYDLELYSSWMAGDRLTDVKCGRLAGCRTAFINAFGGCGASDGCVPDITAVSLLEAASAIIKLRKGNVSYD
jgi:D-glycero-D-manno-heptose 1,7-bisphosphate phosphatase